ncbi:MAG: FAD-dependent oxidoreductase [Chloroflexi bacterium]|nr:FAD-dependent oxidoreductase [Chloroflexota bacterium]MDK1046005.1 FAD-dependent oxidoreductase [Anaerolineales bacterium]
MPNYKYLIVGGGMTADAAVRGIRAVDPEGSLGLIGAEVDPPYNRPPLSKGLWKGKDIDSIWRGTQDQTVELHLGRKIEKVDREARKVIDDQGTEYGYEKLLLATGGRPRRLPFGDDLVLYYRKVEDYRRLQALTQSEAKFAVIGGGFIGSEVAAALAMNNQNVTMIFPEAGVGALQFPADLSAFLNEYYEGNGVTVISGATVEAIESGHGHVHVVTGAGVVHVDAVVAGIGIQPNTALAEAAGLEVEDGVVVQPTLQTNDPDVYAAGDVARFYNPALDRKMRVEHEDNANTMGEMAGRSMAGEPINYDHLPYFYSDLFDLGYEAVGDINPELEIVSDWAEPFKKGLVYYLEKGRVRGVLLWDVWGKVDEARALIAEAGPFTKDDLAGRITPD